MLSITPNTAALLLAGAVTIAAASSAEAQGLVHELKGGLLAHDVPALWSTFQVERNAADINLEVIFRPTMPLFGGVVRPAIGGTVNTRGDTSNAYVDARWEYDTASRIFFGLGLGATLHNGHTGADSSVRKALGSQLLFHIPIEIGYRLDAHSSVSIYFDHMSNAYTQKFNEGLDHLGLRYGYRF